jgi:pimeloyl-ACP methyl ester carboxylesterase
MTSSFSSVPVLIRLAGRVQSNEALVTKFRAECRPAFRKLKRQGVDTFPLMQKCVQDRLAASWTLPSRFDLVEFTPWLVKNRGAEKAEGIIVFITGFGGLATDDSFRLAPYLVKSLNDAGWDVVGAKFPEKFSYYPNPKIFLLSGLAANSIKERTKALRDDGYKRVLIIGHSWGAWVSILHEDRGGKADALIALSPANFGKSTLRNGKSNPAFGKNKTELVKLLAGISTPTVLAFFQRDGYVIPGTGDLAKKALERTKSPHLVLDRPPGFKAHYAGWLPVFDYAYGRCIQALIAREWARPCIPRLLSRSDFRSIVDIKQIANVDEMRISSGDVLAGKKYVSYRLRDVDNKYFVYSSGSRRETQETDKKLTESVSFKGGLHCVNSSCAILLQWSDTEILEFDEGTGAIRAWWIEDR